MMIIGKMSHRKASPLTQVVSHACLIEPFRRPRIPARRSIDQSARPGDAVCTFCPMVRYEVFWLEAASVVDEVDASANQRRLELWEDTDSLQPASEQLGGDAYDSASSGKGVGAIRHAVDRRHIIFLYLSVGTIWAPIAGPYFLWFRPAIE